MFTDSRHQDRRTRGGALRRTAHSIRWHEPRAQAFCSTLLLQNSDEVLELYSASKMHSLNPWQHDIDYQGTVVADELTAAGKSKST